MPLKLQVSAVDDPLGRVFRYHFDSDRRQLLLGRRGGVDVLLPHARVSLVHARIDCIAGGYSVVDEGSTNGTRLAGTLLQPGQRHPLRDGDRLQIADFVVDVAVSAAGTSDGDAHESSQSLARRLARHVLARLAPTGADPRLEVSRGVGVGSAWSLASGRTFLLGRSESCQMRLDDPDVSREHAALARDERGVTVRDLGSKHGTWVGGARVEGERALVDGDLITLGGTTLRFSDPAESYLRRLEAEDQAAAMERAPASVGTAWAQLDRALIAIGVVAAVAAGSALVYVLLW
jgi:pSer/pThr/pTyr-binding forkhead associated (FHA) protein